MWQVLHFAFFPAGERDTLPAFAVDSSYEVLRQENGRWAVWKNTEDGSVTKVFEPDGTPVLLPMIKGEERFAAAKAVIYSCDGSCVVRDLSDGYEAEGRDDIFYTAAAEAYPSLLEGDWIAVSFGTDRKYVNRHCYSDDSWEDHPEAVADYIVGPDLKEVYRWDYDLKPLSRSKAKNSILISFAGRIISDFISLI